MILPVWLTLALIGLTFSVGSYFIQPPKNIIPTIIAGTFWIICAITSTSINEIIVYGNYDYLRAFNFPYLIVFLGLIGLGHYLVAGGKTLKLIEENVDMRDGRLKEMDDGY
jgi:hypothetical protein